MIKYYIFDNQALVFFEVSYFHFYAKLRAYKKAHFSYTIESRHFPDRKERRLLLHSVV